MLSYLIVDPDPETRMDPTPTRDVGIVFGIDFKKVESKLGNFVGKMVSFWVAPKRFFKPRLRPRNPIGYTRPRIRIYPTDFFFYFRLKFRQSSYKQKNKKSVQYF